LHRNTETETETARGDAGIATQKRKSDPFHNTRKTLNHKAKKAPTTALPRTVIRLVSIGSNTALVETRAPVGALFLKNVEVGNPVLVVEDGVVEPLEVENLVLVPVAVLEVEDPVLVPVAVLEVEDPVLVPVAVLEVLVIVLDEVALVLLAVGVVAETAVEVWI